ncbi:MAG TPA: ABC transporter permease [Bryobacteraceae bacterium]|jgi:predicted permease
MHERLWDQLLRDVRYAVRSLRKSPGFAVAAIVTLALGIGANTAIFSALDGSVLAPLAYRDPDRLVMVLLYNRSLKYSTYLSYPDFLDWQREARSFDEMAAYEGHGFDLTSPGMPEHVAGKQVSASFFDTLGVTPALGHPFTPKDDQTGGMPAAVISDRLWRERFGGDRAVVGRPVTLSGSVYTIVGVLKPGFRFETEQADVYTPLGRRNTLLQNDRTNHDLASIARLAPGVSLSQARAEMNAIQERIGRLYPATEKGLGTSVDPLKEMIIGDAGGTLLLLLGAVGFVLLIACANVANLLLARSAGRAREFAVRLALGAGRGQIIRQVMVESVLLSLTGGLLGLVLAKWGLSAVLAAAPGSLPRMENISLNAPVLLFALAISMAVGLLFGIMPALKHSNVDLQTGLRAGGRGTAGGHQRMQAVLAVVQIALALVLLSGASLLFRTIHNLWEVNPGFNFEHVVTFQVGLSPTLTQTAAGIRTAYTQLLERIREVPGVTAADMTALLPLSQGDNSGPFWVGSQQPAVSMAQIPRARYFWTGPDYLKTMQIPLLRGRFVTAEDTVHSEKVIAIDSLMARMNFADRDPIGQTITVPHWGEARIVGVVGHVEHMRLDGSATLFDKPQIYGSFYQLSDQWVPAFRQSLRIAVRTPLDSAAAMAAIMPVVYGTGNDQPVYNIHTMHELAAGSMAGQRFPMLLLVAFAALALVLATVGIYGVISYSTAQRVPEIGVRMALGAAKWDVLRMLAGQGLRLALAGVAIGVAAAMVLTRALASFSRLLYGVKASDPLTLAGVSLFLIAAALVACWIPARRAARIDPMIALRQD